jgi:hypothetical protein
MYMYILSVIMHRKLNPEEYILNKNNHLYNIRNKTKVIVVESQLYSKKVLIMVQLRNVTNRNLFKILISTIFVNFFFFF